ncbi:MAG: hypothetical protein JXA73_08815 [Acidobacteria bacterium]|nr:hypothetical protein [Acidobacteriota bacterium]
MAGITNRGKYKFLDWLFRGTSLPTNFYIALVTSATAPVADTNTKSELTEIVNGNGYTTGGISLTKNSTDFDVLTEDDANDYSLVQLKDIVWTASGGSLPASGGGARYAVLTDDNATQGSRLILVYWDLSSDRSVSSGQTLTLQNCEVRLTE